MSAVMITADADQALRLYEAGVISLKELRIWLGFRAGEPVRDHGFKVGDVVKDDDYERLPVGTRVAHRTHGNLKRWPDGYVTDHGDFFYPASLRDERTIVHLP